MPHMHQPHHLPGRAGIPDGVDDTVALPQRTVSDHAPLCTSQAPCLDCVLCQRCQTLTAVDETVTTVRGSTICDTCRERYYWYCDGCDGYNRYTDVCGNNCDADEDDDDNGDGLVHDYYYRPLPVFHGTGPLFLGGELEVATPPGRDRDCARIASAHLGALGYLKRDSSIGDGFEIVTHPMAYPWAMTHFPWQMLAELRAAGARITDATGIHVHVSRAGFISTCHTYRWMKFVYRNQQYVQRLARRTSPQWAAFTEHDRRRVKDYAKGGYGDRYRAINTNNADTFELRVFAGSLDPGQIQAALGFAAASVEYTRTLSVPQIARHGGWQWPAFVDWLDEHPAYAPLRSQLEVLSCAS
jgi:hypothetical protein